MIHVRFLLLVKDVTDFIRTPQVNNAVSIVASYKGCVNIWLNDNDLWQKLVALYWMDVISVPLYYLMRN